VELAREHSRPVISGGDRHACEPSACLNLTDAHSFAEFAAELLANEFGVREPPEVPEHFRAGDIRHCFADIRKIRRDLGYAPRVSLAEGLPELLSWLRTQKAEDRVEEARRELERRGLSQ
jgi:nucleoside-diphosphate-sugar epimerase